MARIELIGLGHRYPGQAEPALWPLDLVWEDGSACALLGPSGCGKTTLLNLVSGLVVPEAPEARVLFDGKDVTRLSPVERNLAQVFQFPVVYDTMSVFENLAFPLRNRRQAAPAVEARVREIAELLELSPLLSERARGLPADIKQLLSLGRGLVRQDVAAVLFDEPLTVIDPARRRQLRHKLQTIRESLRLTMVYVTHDQTEALTFADDILVMRAGRVLQRGTPRALFERPAHAFVGHFIGSPGMNFIPDGATWLGIRPEFIQIVRAGQGRPGHVRAVVPRGAFVLVRVQSQGRDVHVRCAPDQVPETGSECGLFFPPEYVCTFPREAGAEYAEFY